MVLDFFFIFFDLIFHFVQGLIKGRDHLVSLMMRDEIVLVLGIHQDFDLDPILIERQRDFDGSYALEIGEQFFRLFGHVVLNVLLHAPVFTRKGNLLRSKLLPHENRCFHGFLAREH